MGRTTLALCLSLPLAGCVSARVAWLEQRVAALEEQQRSATMGPTAQERLDSVTAAIDKDRRRLDAIVPADAQWMRLDAGGVLRWYLSPLSETAYLQFRSLDPGASTVEVDFVCAGNETALKMRPGETWARRVQTSSRTMYVEITLHRLRHVQGGPTWALLSVTPVSDPPPE